MVQSSRLSVSTKTSLDSNEKLLLVETNSPNLRCWLVKFHFRPEVDTKALPSIGINPQCSGTGEGTTMACLPGLKSQEIEFEEQRKTGGREGARSEASASVLEENIS